MIKTICTVLIIAFWAVILTGASVTAETRFTFEETENGYILLDQQNGTISRCTKTDSGFSCNLDGADYRHFEKRLQILEQNVDELQKKLNKFEGSASSRNIKSGESELPDIDKQATTEIKTVETTTRETVESKVEHDENRRSYKESIHKTWLDLKIKISAFTNQALQHLFAMVEEIKQQSK